MLISELSEEDIIESFSSYLPVGDRTILGPGDDCAIVAAPEQSFLISCDVIVGNEHFLTSWSTYYEIGERVAAQNLADIAAMGGRASSLVVTIVLPRDMEVDDLVDVVRGMSKRAEEAGAGIVGGDLSSGTEFALSVTVNGWVEGEAVKRSGAQVGDTIAVAGTLGRSAAGLELLSRGLVDPEERDPGILGPCAEPLSIYRAPRPPLEAGPIARRHGAHAMMDLSDGLVRDAGRMATASHVVMSLSPDALVADERALSRVADVCGHSPQDWILYGGEDHGLLACFPPGVVLPAPFRPIGQVEKPLGGNTGIRMGQEFLTGGWDHFRQ